MSLVATYVRGRHAVSIVEATQNYKARYKHPHQDKVGDRNCEIAGVLEKGDRQENGKCHILHADLHRDRTPLGFDESRELAEQIAKRDHNDEQYRHPDTDRD